MQNILHNFFSSVRKLVDFLKGFIQVSTSRTERYNYVIKDIKLVIDEHYRVIVIYSPLVSYRPQEDYISTLNNSYVCRDFKPDHARIIIGISTLETNLNFSEKNQVKLYLDFVNRCKSYIKE